MAIEPRRQTKRPGLERSEVRIGGRVDEDGNLAGEIEIRWTGGGAVPWIREALAGGVERSDEDARRVISALLPGVEMAELELIPGDLPVPEYRIRAAIMLPDLVRGDPGKRWLRPRAFSRFPDLGGLEVDAFE